MPSSWPDCPEHGTISALRFATTTAVPVPVATSAVSSAPSVVSSAPSVVSSSPAPVSTGSSSSGVTGAGQYGMTFSPYTNGGDCMPQSDIFNNLKIIKSKGFDLVRVYSTDCNGLEYIGSACKELGLKIMMGVFIDGSGISAAQHQVDAIAKWAQWDMVELIVVGNEAISSGACSAGDLAGFVASSKATFKAAGYSGQVTTTEPINIWQQYGKSTLCGVVDIVGANIHPFFNAQVTAEQAGEFALAELKELEEICGKEVINCETGWPNAGESNGKAVPGVSEQEIAIKRLWESNMKTLAEQHAEIETQLQEVAQDNAKKRKQLREARTLSSWVGGYTALAIGSPARRSIN